MLHWAKIVEKKTLNGKSMEDSLFVAVWNRSQLDCNKILFCVWEFTQTSVQNSGSISFSLGIEEDHDMAQEKKLVVGEKEGNCVESCVRVHFTWNSPLLSFFPNLCSSV